MPEDIRKRYQAALDLKASFHGMFYDAYKYVFPGRPGFEVAAPGQNDAHEIYDSTAVIETANLAARLQNWVAPIEGRWMAIEPGMDGGDPEELEALTSEVFAAIGASEFDAQLYEALQDMVVSTGALRLWDGGPDKPLSVQAVPLSRLALEPGPFDSIGGIFATWSEMTREAVVAQWPDAVIKETPPDRRIEVVEATVRDYGRRDAEVWHYYVFIAGQDTALDDRTFVGQGSNPWIVFRWAKAPGEVYGRGPVLHALPDIRTLNLTVELVLDNAELAIAGMYNVDDDGVVNPNAINIVPGAIIPRAQGSSGLEPIQSPGRFDVSQLVMEDLRAAIRRALLGDTVTPPDARTPPTATQVLQHQAEQLGRLAPAVARLGPDFYRAVAARTLYILNKRGNIGTPPRLDLREALVRATSPMATVKALEQLDATNRWIDLVGARSPETAMLVGDMEAYAEYSARVLGVPAHIVRDAAKRTAHLKKMGELAMQAKEQGVME